MENKRNPTIYRFLTLALYFGDACFTPFFSLYFAQSGLSTLETSILLALVPFSFFAGNVFYSMFETSWKRNVFLIRMIAILEAVFLIALAYSRSFFLLLPTTILAAFHNSCLFSLIDGMGAGSAKRRNIPFSFVRIMGSIGYITASLFAFYFMDKIGYSWMFTISALIIFLCFPISFLLVPYTGDEFSKRVELTEAFNQEKKSDFFKNPNLWLFLVFSAFYWGGLNNYNYIVPIFMEQQGLTAGQTAIWTVVRVAVEMVIMLLIPVFKKLFKSNKNLLIVASSFGLLALLFNAVITNFQVILWATFIARGLGYGFGLVSVVLFAEEIVGERDCSKACSLSNGVLYGLCGALNLLSPYIYESIGFTAYFWIVFGIMALGTCSLFFIKIKRDSSEKSLAN